MALQLSTTIVCHAFTMDFLAKGHSCSAKVFLAKGPSFTTWLRQITKCDARYVTMYDVNPHSTEQDTQPIVLLISKQVIPYRTRGGTCCPGVSTPKIPSLADLSTTCQDGTNHLHHSNHFSNHNIDLHMVNSHLDAWETTTLSKWHEPYSTSQRIEDLYNTHDCRAKQIYPDTIPNHKSTKWVFNLGNACNSVTRGRKHIRSTWSRNTCLASCLLLLKVFSS
jgi:hypothetical protein